MFVIHSVCVCFFAVYIFEFFAEDCYVYSTPGAECGVIPICPYPLQGTLGMSLCQIFEVSR